MERLQKKCVIASAGAHLLLMLTLLVGPGFLAPKETIQDQPVIDFIPSKLVDEAVMGGGNPNARPMPVPENKPPETTPAPPPPAPEPEPERVKPPPTPTPAPAPVPEKKAPTPERNPDSLEPVTEKKVRKPVANTTLVTKKTDTDKAKKEAAEAAAREQREKETRDARKNAANRVLSAAKNIGSGSAAPHQDRNWRVWPWRRRSRLCQLRLLGEEAL